MAPTEHKQAPARRAIQPSPACHVRAAKAPPLLPHAAASRTQAAYIVPGPPYLLRLLLFLLLALEYRVNLLVYHLHAHRYRPPQELSPSVVALTPNSCAQSIPSRPSPSSDLSHHDRSMYAQWHVLYTNNTTESTLKMHEDRLLLHMLPELTLSSAMVASRPCGGARDTNRHVTHAIGQVSPADMEPRQQVHERLSAPPCKCGTPTLDADSKAIFVTKTSFTVLTRTHEHREAPAVSPRAPVPLPAIAATL